MKKFKRIKEVWNGTHFPDLINSVDSAIDLDEKRLINRKEPLPQDKSYYKNTPKSSRPIRYQRKK